MLMVLLCDACQQKEPKQISESMISFSLIQNPTVPFLLYQSERFAGKALISLNGQLRICCVREYFRSSLVGFSR